MWCTTGLIRAACKVAIPPRHGKVISSTTISFKARNRPTAIGSIIAPATTNGTPLEIIDPIAVGRLRALNEIVVDEITFPWRGGMATLHAARINPVVHHIVDVLAVGLQFWIAIIIVNPEVVMDGHELFAVEQCAKVLRVHALADDAIL